MRIKSSTGLAPTHGCSPGIMGHNLCLDIFGGPSDEEAVAGLTAHGEASVARYQIEGSVETMTMTATLPLAQIIVRRRIDLEGCWVRVRESVENLAAQDRPIGWTQHVTLGPPYLEQGTTEFHLPATRSKVFEGTFGPADYLKAGAEFDWPLAPLENGGTRDLRQSNARPISSAYTAHLLDPALDQAWFAAFSPAAKLVFGYVWRRADFPWVGIWEENNSRTHSPWDGRTRTRAVEFGVSPFPESRREMVERGRLFGQPTFRWLPARRTLEVRPGGPAPAGGPRNLLRRSRAPDRNPTVRRRCPTGFRPPQSACRPCRTRCRRRRHRPKGRLPCRASCRPC